MENNQPKCVGVIMDGNRRWAKEKGLSAIKGHKAGADKLKDVVKWSVDVGVEHLIAYAFSTENWNRSEEEISYLMNLIHLVFGKNIDEFNENQIKVRFIGQRDRFDRDIQDILLKVEDATANNTKLELIIALSYGGRSEIVHAVREIIDSGEKEVTEEIIQKHLWTKNTPDPELIMRTGGKLRLSNFLTWQSVYSELYFTNTYWPALTEREYKDALSGFGGIQRNFGI